MEHLEMNLRLEQKKKLLKINLENDLVVGSKIKIGREYSEKFGFEVGEIITLIEGSFEYDNGLYNALESAPSIWDEEENDYNSIYHLFGNDLEDFLDNEIIYKPIKPQ